MNYGKSKKNKTKILVIAAALALVITTAVFLVCFTGDNKGYRTISVVDITGTVSVVKDGIEYSAYPGMILQEGHEIVTAANSYVRLVLDDDKYVKLEAGSRLVFETLGLLGSNKTQMNLERGSLTSEIVKPLESDAQYVVVAPNAVLSVRGTFFRVDLGVAENGEITADVMTYGGQVASQRIMPTGEVIEEEVLIDAGFKTSINMDTDDTVYVMQAVGGAVDTTGDGVANLAPIVVTDIPDDDMVDIYFAAENGHELFVSAEEAKVDIEDRGIDLEAQTSVYELAETIKEEAEETSAVTLAGAEVFADDGKPIARVEEPEEGSEVVEEVSSEKPITTVVSVLTDGDGQAKEEVHVHSYTIKETLEATCEVAGVNTYTCACGDSYTEEIPATGHISVNGGTASAHVKCNSCGETLNGSTAHSYVQEVTAEPTCTTTGVRTYSCSCGHVYTEEIAALGHSEVAGNASDCHSQCFVCKEILVGGSGHIYSGSVTTAATCTTAGVRTFTCSCGHSYTEAIAASGHSTTTGGTENCHSKCSVCQATITDGSAHTFTVTETDATCTQAGKTTYTCACGYSYTKESEVLAHTYTSEITTEATCTTAGVKTFTCACGNSYTEEIPATGHSETNGGTESCHSKCSVCQATITDGSAHTFTANTTEATCTTAGKTTYTCECGYSYVKETEAMGHTEVVGATADCHSKCDVCGEVISSTHKYTDTREEASCTEAGMITHACDCGYSYTEDIVATGHTEVAGATETCHSKCDVCGEVISTTHSYGEPEVTEATCTVAGKKVYNCECGYSYEEAIPATGHTEVAGATADCHSKCGVCQATIEDGTSHTYESEITTAATCTTTGVETYSCACGYSYTKEIEATGHTEVAGSTADCHSKCDVCDAVISTTHSYGEPEVTGATCTADGKEVYSCGCGYTYEEIIPSTGHTEVAGSTADCHSKCDVCDAVISATHSYGEPEVTGATCTADGKEVYSCECGYTYEEIIPSTGHTEVAGATADCHSKCEICGEVISTAHTYTDSTKAATCTEAGFVDHVCDCGYEYTEEIAATGHTEVMVGEADCHSKCDVCGEVLSSTHTYTDSTREATCTTAGLITHTCDCGYSYTEDIAATGHTEVMVGEADCHSKCEICGEVLATTHTITGNITTEPTCTTTGVQTYSCECGYSYTTEIEALGHVETIGGTETCHSKCDVCHATITDGSGHEFTSEITTAATCTTAGVETYSCACGYSYTKEIAITDHTEVVGGTEDCHSKCDVCDAVISTTHSYGEPEITIAATCTTAGVETYSCACGYSYTEEIEAFGHEGTGEGSTTCKHCGLAMLELNVTNFPDTAFLEYVKTNFNTVTTDDEILLGEEVNTLTTCTEINVSGTQGSGGVYEDGGISDLTGIEYFTALTTLNCSYNSGLTGIPTSALTNLTTLNITNCTSISSIDLTACSNLTSLTAEGCTSLKTIDASGCPELTFLDADSSGVEIVNVNGCTKITTLSNLQLYPTNSLVELHAQGVPAISGADLGFSDRATLEVIDFSGCTDMTTLNLSNCPALKTVNLSGCTNLATLNLTDSTAITDLNISGTKLTGLDVSGCADLATLTPATGLTSLDISGCTSLTTLDTASLTALTTLMADNSGLTSLDVTACTNIAEISVHTCTALTEINASGCTKLTAIQHADCSSLNTVNISNCTAFKAVSINSLTAIETYNANNCTSLTSFKAETGGSTLKTLELTGCTSLTELILTAATDLTTLKIGQCSALTSLDISMLTNLEVFYANSAGIKTLSGNATCLDFSSNPNLKEIQVNMFTSFTEIDLTTNTALEKFVYNSMPMTTIDLSYCVSLQNFQIGNSKVTSLDFSNCPEMIRIINNNSSALTAINVNGCTKIYDIRLLNSNNVSSVDITNAGTDVVVGAYVPDKYLVFTATAGSTTESALKSAAGWNDAIMYMSNTQL